MTLIYPEEIKKLIEIRKPYMDGVHLKPDAPEFAVKADEEIMAWFDENHGPYEQ